MIRALLTTLAGIGALGALLFAASAPGCGPACPASERTYAEGTTEIVGGIAYYESSPAAGPYLPYEGNTLLHVKHTIGVEPKHWAAYLSFSEYPEVVGGGGSSSAAGNQAVFLRIGIDEIAVKNDSCANYWIRVVASGPAAVVEAGVLDAQGDVAAGTDVASEAAADVEEDVSAADAATD